MGGGVVGAQPSRVRIKGHAPSVIRFFLIAVAYMLPWVLITSQLGYYSRWFGPQILLELNLAFYVPSIPVLMISGQIEKVLAARVGPTASMALRLGIGLVGCTIGAALFPWLPSTHTSLLVLVGVLGTLSAIAFSTAYQMVQWFRHADIIGLGLGGVCTGPLVLILQLMLGVGPHPERWQWLAMFEATACIMGLGCLGAVSLFGQYWKIMSGDEEYHDAFAPLLSEEDRADELEEERKMAAAKAATANIMLQPDPFHGLPMMPSSPDFDQDSEDRSAPRLGRLPRAQLKRAHSHSTGQLGTKAIATNQNSSYHGDKSQGRSLGRATAPPLLGVAPVRSHSVDVQPPLEGAAWFGPAGAGLVKSPFASAAALQLLDAADRTEQGRQDAGRASGVPHTSPAPLTVQQENMAVVQQSWQVLLAFISSVTIMYLVFPFFTYVKSSGLIGDELPKTLFYARIFADIAGRFAPRRKSLLVRDPYTLLVMSVFKLAVTVLFFLYLKSPDRFHHDFVPILIVVLIWGLGGYINTSANIMAPSMVDHSLVGRASALLALIFQVAHFVGLVLAVVLAFALYGDIVG